MKQEKLNEIIAEHAKWLEGLGGRRADLCEADLGHVNLCRADLCEADLGHANLYGADLRGVDLGHANLCEADLGHANLYEADLRGADLCHANLYGADLRGADLCHTNLHQANLEGAKLPTGIYQIVGVGSCNRCTTYDSINDRVICGCWDDEKGNHLDSFARRIEEIYGTKGKEPNPKHYAEYMSAVAFFKAMGSVS